MKTRNDPEFLTFRRACDEWVAAHPGQKCIGASRWPLEKLARLAYPGASARQLSKNISEELCRKRPIIEPKAGKRPLGAPTCASAAERKKTNARWNPINNPRWNPIYNPITNARLKALHAEWARQVRSCLHSSISLSP